MVSLFIAPSTKSLDVEADSRESACVSSKLNIWYNLVRACFCSYSTFSSIKDIIRTLLWWAGKNIIAWQGSSVKHSDAKCVWWILFLRGTPVDSRGKGGLWNFYGAGIFFWNSLINLCKGSVILEGGNIFLENSPPPLGINCASLRRTLGFKRGWEESLPCTCLPSTRLISGRRVPRIVYIITYHRAAISWKNHIDSHGEKSRHSASLVIMHQSIPSPNIPLGTPGVLRPTFSPGPGICSIWMAWGLPEGLLS